MKYFKVCVKLSRVRKEKVRRPRRRKGTKKRTKRLKKRKAEDQVLALG